jgi:tetratricopeptide (TPR) repeat protein
LQDGTPDLDALFDQGIQLRLSGQVHEATRVLKAAVRRFPNQAGVLWYLGGIYLHDLKQAAKALPYYTKASQLAPQSERASLGVFHSLWQLGRHREAMKELARFQSVAHCRDYVKILADVREEAPELLPQSLKTKAS